MIAILKDERVHHEVWSDGSISVFLPATGETWQSWSKKARDIRQRISQVRSDVLDGPVPVAGVKLHGEPKAMTRPYAGNIFEPLINVQVSTEETWEEARDEALTYSGIATVDSMGGKPFRRPETIASSRKGTVRGAPPAAGSQDNPVNQLCARLNATGI